MGMFLQPDISAQLKYPKTYQGEYNAVTLFSGTDVAAADTSATLEVPFAVKQSIFYLKVDTVTTSDTLKSMVIQGSPDGVNWVNTSYTFSNVTAAGGQRVAATLVDKYLRFIFAVGGSAVKIDFSLKAVPK